MNLLKKLLLIVVVGVLIGNEYGAAAPMPILDLPDKTPGLQYDEQIKRVTGVDTLCVHVIVPNTPAANLNDLADQLVAPGNIYFPVNGVQPTTPEAVEYSCANVDNREDSPITEWYMQMFGVIPVNRANVDVAHVEQNVPYPIYVRAGWINNANLGTQRIISFDATVNEIQEHDPSMPGMKISRQNLFKREFRKIASTSVGRTLLYRILIEVRRHLPDGSGCFETENINRLNECYASDRNRLRHIRITFDELEEMGFFSGDGKINIKNAPILPYEISETQFKDNSFKIEKAINSYLDVNIFHEFIHYFYSLRHFMRREVEKFYVWVTILPNEFECSF